MDLLISIMLLLIVSIAVVISGMKKVPGIGIFVSVAVIAFAVFLRKQDMAYLGFKPVESWLTTVGWSILLGVLIALLSSFLIEPFANRLTGESHDFSIFDGMRGNIQSLIMYMLMAWVLAAFLEEIIFRGYLISEMTSVLGSGAFAIALSILLGSVIFGFAHWYQGKSGVLSTGVVGAILAVIFVVNDFNIWLPILTHGFIDTVGLGLIYFGLDIQIDEWVQKTFWKAGD